MLHGLPVGYHRDLQEDKEPLFDAVDTLDLGGPGDHRSHGDRAIRRLGDA